MGIKGNRQLLTDRKKLMFSNNRFKFIIIDAYPMIYRWSIGFINNGEYIVDENNKNISEIYFIFKIAVKFLSEMIIPVFVFDGKAPSIKSNTIKKRNKTKEKATNILNNINYDVKDNNNNKKEIIKQLKRKFQIDRDNIDRAKFILKLMGLPVINARGEADPQCAILSTYYSDKVVGVLSDDFDPLLYSSKNILNLPHINCNYLEEYNIEDILKNLENKCNNKFELDNLIDIGCLMGNDYFSGIKTNCKKNNRLNEILNIYCKYDMSLDNMLLNYPNFSERQKDNILLSKNQYKNTKVIHPKNISLEFNKPNILFLKDVCKNIISEKSLDSSIEIIKKTFDNYKSNYRKKIKKNITLPIPKKTIPINLYNYKDISEKECISN